MNGFGGFVLGGGLREDGVVGCVAGFFFGFGCFGPFRDGGEEWFGLLGLFVDVI